MVKTKQQNFKHIPELKSYFDFFKYIYNACIVYSSKDDRIIII